MPASPMCLGIQNTESPREDDPTPRLRGPDTSTCHSRSLAMIEPRFFDAGRMIIENRGASTFSSDESFHDRVASIRKGIAKLSSATFSIPRPSPSSFKSAHTTHTYSKPASIGSEPAFPGSVAAHLRMIIPWGLAPNAKRCPRGRYSSIRRRRTLMEASARKRRRQSGGGERHLFHDQLHRTCRHSSRRGLARRHGGVAHHLHVVRRIRAVRAAFCLSLAEERPARIDSAG